MEEMSGATPPTTYFVSRPVMLRAMGMTVAAAGVVWLLIGLLALVGVDFSSQTVLILLSLTGIVVVASTARVRWPPRLLELTGEGYRLRVRGGAVREARWREVKGVETHQSATGAFVLIRLTGERTSVIPCRLLGACSIEAQHEIHDRLNAAHGYRRLDGA
jgi:hypothetical protein